MSGQVEPAPPRAGAAERLSAGRLLPFLLSVVAGTTDVVGFLLFGGLFTAHITGNLVILAAHIVNEGVAPFATLISVPVFVVVLALARIFAETFTRTGGPSLRPMLILQFLLLAGFLLLGTMGGPRIDIARPVQILAGMLAVSAMAVQNVLVRVSLKDTPSTAVMTTNVTMLVMEVGDMVFARDPASAVEARRKAGRIWPAVAGFLIGCALGAAGVRAFGRWALIAPAGLAALALVVGMAVEPAESKGRS